VLTPVLTRLLDRAGVDLEQVEISAAGRRSVLRVVVDRDGGVDLDSVAELSRMISVELDSTEIMGAMPYVLEVSSPGVDRLLTRPVHWRRAIGRLVCVDLIGGGRLEARVLATDEDGVDLGDPGTVGSDLRRVRYPEVAAARVQVEFTRPAQGGADEADAEETGPDEADADETGKEDQERWT
jgi:ribosome maturation factor RimP